MGVLKESTQKNTNQLYFFMVVTTLRLELPNIAKVAVYLATHYVQTTTNILIYGSASLQSPSHACSAPHSYLHTYLLYAIQFEICFTSMYVAFSLFNLLFSYFCLLDLFSTTAYVIMDLCTPL